MKSKVSPTVANQLQKQEKCAVDISSPKLASTTTATRDCHEPRQVISASGKKNSVMDYNVKEDQAEIRSVMPESVQECLQAMGWISLNTINL